MIARIIDKLLGRSDGRDALRPLYAAIVTEARQPHWYAQGGVEDSISGRFEMLASVFALAAIRLEALGEPARRPLALVTECFVEDMEGQLRESGVGDVVIGKQMGILMSALGGRLQAFRDGLAGDLAPALVRNLYRGSPSGPTGLAHAEAAIRALHARLAATPLDSLIAGRVAP